MLTHLIIKNYALIKHLEIFPSPSLNVITGETGAGKSIMLGAIGLLLGNRADSKVLWDENEKCVTEGTFDIAEYKLESLFEEQDLDYHKETVIRREISPGGKSRAFINDTPVTLDVMRKIGNRLMDIHSQHETLELGNKLFQLNLIDSFAGNEKLKLIYSEKWKAYLTIKKEYENLVASAEELKKESDFITFQLDELAKANLQIGELEQLEEALKVMEHAEEIKVNFNAALDQMARSDYSLNSIVASIRSNLQAVSSFSKDYEQLLQRFESARIELNDLANEIEKEEEKIEFDPDKTEETKNRISLLYQLLQKHRAKEVTELIELRNSLAQKVNKVLNLDGEIENGRKEFSEKETAVKESAIELSNNRKKIFNHLIKELTSLLKELGMPEAQLSIDHNSIEPGPYGIDSIELLFSANKGVSPKPLAQVASGGEFSRFMFSIKYVMAEKTALPTLILDEIDTGVSGEIAFRLGDRMKEMARNHQVISISHLPQIASKADSHFFVYKDNSSSKTLTLIKKLNENERITEIAQMIGGANPSNKVIENAREMLKI